MRLIMNFLKKRDDPNPSLKSDNLLLFDQSLKLSSAKLLWKAKNHVLPDPIESIFTRRNSLSFHVPHRRIDLTQNCISFSGVQVWNRMPQKIKLAKSINSFRTNYKKFLLNSWILILFPRGWNNANITAKTWFSIPLLDPSSLRRASLDYFIPNSIQLKKF